MLTSIRRQRGLSAIRPYTPGIPIEEVKRKYGLSDVVKLASNENPLGVSPAVISTMQSALAEMNLYPDAQAYSLTQAIAAHLGVQPDQVRVGNGTDGVVREICAGYLEDDDEVIVSRSSFPVYDISASVMRARVVRTPLKGYGLDLKAMAAAITARTKIIFVCNPNNPTGTIVTASEVGAFMRRLPDHVIVVFDEAYYEFVESDEYPDTIQYVRLGRPNVIVLRTFSKVYGMAGLRLGYGLADPELLAPMRACSESFPVNRLAQLAGEAALADREFLRRTVEVNQAGRHYLYAEFDRLGLQYAPSHTNFILVQIGPQAGAVFQELLRRGVIVRPCGGYDLPEFLRITIGTAEQNVRLVATLEAVLHAESRALCGDILPSAPVLPVAHGPG